MVSPDDMCKESLRMKTITRFVKDESGATAIEYGLIAALIAVAIIVGATLLGGQLGLLFQGIGTTIDNATP
jgi:pilus assembly protein Flp/PilA